MTSLGTQSLTLATKITVTRVLLVPVFVICLAYRRAGLALAIFLLASLADAVDGHLARRRGEKTALGAMLDPIADKLLMFSAYVLMGTNGEIPAWLSIIVVSRDVLLCVGCFLLYMTVRFVTPEPSLLGKTTTAAQMASVLAALTVSANGAGNPTVLFILHGFTGALTIASGFHYLFFAGARMLTQRESTPGAKAKSAKATTSS